jgi:putative transposase
MGVVRCIYNLALEQRNEHWRQYRAQTGKFISFPGQCRELTDLRAQFDWIAAMPRNPQEAALRVLDRAYGAFFAGRAKGPQFRRRGERDGLVFKGRDAGWRQLNAKWGEIRISGVGWIKVRATRRVDGRWLSCAVTERGGRWYVSIGCELPASSGANTGKVVGIDRGVAQTLTLSNGEIKQAPEVGGLRLRLKRAQQALARKRKGSKRRAAQKARVAKLNERMGNRRADWCHRASTDIARRFGLVAIENLNIANMTASGRRKRGLNRSILDQCWGKFATLLAYKLDERGGRLVAVPAAYTSQTCASCGVVDARSRKSQAVFECVHCDHADNADVNAAKEILRRSTASMGVEGRHFCPDEALIMAAA